jgi:SAM-dependent methyltransferase
MPTGSETGRLMTAKPGLEQRRTGLLTGILHRIVSQPWVYDQVQVLAGVRKVHSRLEAQFAPLASAATVLDLGGGTGLLRDLWPPTCAYVCLDIDMLKLRGFLSKHPGGVALLSDATRVALRSSSVDVVLCAFVAHHVPDELLGQLIGESVRVLKGAGKLILVDPVWTPERWIGRLIWKYDRGSYPRSAETLRSVISSHCAITHWEIFAIYHEYALCVATKPPAATQAQHREGEAPWRP